jgi:hypothetical protein
MNVRPQLITLIVVAIFAPAKLLAASEGPAFVGNEAVSFHGGARKVDLPPLSAAASAFQSKGGKGTKPFGQSEVYMIEVSSGLVECSLPYFSEAACAPSSLGQVKRPRFWTVKLGGSWQHCSSRSQGRRCEPASAGVPGAMSAVE